MQIGKSGRKEIYREKMNGMHKGEKEDIDQMKEINRMRVKRQTIAETQDDDKQEYVRI